MRWRSSSHCKLLRESSAPFTTFVLSHTKTFLELSLWSLSADAVRKFFISPNGAGGASELSGVGGVLQMEDMRGAQERERDQREILTRQNEMIRVSKNTESFFFFFFFHLLLTIVLESKGAEERSE